MWSSVLVNGSRLLLEFVVSLGTHPRRRLVFFVAILPHTILYTSTSFTKPIDHSVEPFVAIMSVLP